MPIASVPDSAALTGSLGKLDNGHRHCPRRSPSAPRVLRIAASTNRVAHISVVSRPRLIAEDRTDAVIAQDRTEFPSQVRPLSASSSARGRARCFRTVAKLSNDRFRREPTFPQPHRDGVSWVGSCRARQPIRESSFLG